MNKTDIITTPCGDISGIDNGEWCEYRGIKYADAGRWEYPVEKKKWDGVYDATEWGECSFQRRAFEDDAHCNRFYHKEFRQGLSFRYSEDCQFLNIWAPKEKDGCPVFIYIHGGSFTGGSSNESHLNGTEFAKNGIIFVTLNYRLGPFGFCSHPSLRDDEGRCGNYGLYDIVTAISWIRNNIGAFGGDADCITIAGQSAGAMAVDLIISGPMCKGWFKRAIVMSGAGLQRIAKLPSPAEKYEDFWNKIISNASVSNMEELKKVDEKRLFYAWSDACSSEKGSMFATLPINDGKLITAECFNRNTIPGDMQYIMGVTSTDMVPVALELITKKWCRCAEKNGAKCYIYNFFRDLPGDDAGAWHSCDLLYAFNTMKYNWRPFEDIDRKIADEISSAFYAFIRSGDPNCDKIPRWEPGAKKPMRFCENTRAMKWDTITMIKNTFSNKGAEF